MKNDLMFLRLNEAIGGLRDEQFAEIVSSIHCMSRPRVYAVLNAIVSSMDPGELYVEVGTYQGGSLISALHENSSRAIGVDSFGEFTQTNNYQLTSDNLSRFGVADRVTLYDVPFAQFFREAAPDMQIAVYYYDGAHDYETQLAGMEAAWSRLHPGSIILVDDYTYPEVWMAINKFVANHLANIKFEFVVLPPQNTDPIWWNGCVVLRVV